MMEKMELGMFFYLRELARAARKEKWRKKKLRKQWLKHCKRGRD